MSCVLLRDDVGKVCQTYIIVRRMGSAHIHLFRLLATETSRYDR